MVVASGPTRIPDHRQDRDMARKRLARARSLTAQCICRWLRDRVWPTLDPLPKDAGARPDPATLPVAHEANEAVLGSMYERLCAELASEADRTRAVETKLAAVGAVMPVAVTILVAVATFLSSGHARD